MSESPKRTVRIRATIEYDLEVPEFMTDKDVEFHRNQGTYCTDSIVEELESHSETHDIAYNEEGYRPCMCGLATFEVLESPERHKIRDPRLYM